LRKELGEPAPSVAKYNVPLPEATSRSPEALELLTLGYRRQLDESSQAAIPYYERAVLVGGVSDPKSIAPALMKEMYIVGHCRGHYRGFMEPSQEFGELGARTIRIPNIKGRRS
jgi:hypothetical protein